MEPTECVSIMKDLCNSISPCRSYLWFCSELPANIRFFLSQNRFAGLKRFMLALYSFNEFYRIFKLERNGIQILGVPRINVKTGTRQLGVKTDAKDNSVLFNRKVGRYVLACGASYKSRESIIVTRFGVCMGDVSRWKASSWGVSGDDSEN